MTWGGGAYEDIPNGTIWDGWATGREWEAAGTGLDLYEGMVGFRFYSAVWSGSAWGSYTEITDDIGVFRFQINRGLVDWWKSGRTGSATLTVDFPTDDFSTLDQRFYLGRRIRIAVEVPGGSATLYTGMVSSRSKTYDARGYPTLTVQLMDHYGWIAQNTYPALTSGTQGTGTMLSSLLTSYGSAITAAEVAGINPAQGLSQQGTLSAGNLVDLLNTYVRGELGALYVDRSGVFQFAARDWWYPFPNPQATIGSLDRAAGGDRDDPSPDTGYKFPADYTQWQAPIEYTEVKWTTPHAGTASTTTGWGSGATYGVFGARRWNDTVNLTSTTDISANLAYLANALTHFPYEEWATVRIPVDTADAAMDFCASVELLDYVNVAKETQLHLARREWYAGHIFGIRHSYSPQVGWICELDVTTQIVDSEVDPE